MDSLTHIALGACIGEAYTGKSLGKKSMIWGALAQSIPDIDFIASSWMTPAQNLLAHRGFTHSILFALLVTPAFAMAAERLHRPHNISFRRWLLFFGTQLVVHLVLDSFNNYGVGWFVPFNDYRISFNILYVADPFFSIWTGLGAIFLIVTKRSHSKRRFVWISVISLSTLYLVYAILNKVSINRDVRDYLREEKISYKRFFSTPTPLNNWLWFVVVEKDSGYEVGYRSVFDTKEKIDFNFFAKNDRLLNPVRDHEDVRQLIKFSKGYYTVEYWNDTLVFNDLRFGQIIGWVNPKERFVFHYYIRQDAENVLVVQRGRFAKWDWNVIKEMWRRIRGN